MFFGSLTGTGFLVAIITDLANHLGCVLYLKNSVTAITFLALGTSIPGNFAHKTGKRFILYQLIKVAGTDSVRIYFLNFQSVVVFIHLRDVQMKTGE